MRMTIEGVRLPQRKTLGSCGYDIHCPTDLVVYHQPTTIDLGILMEPGDIPDGYFAMLVPRSSTGSKDGLHLRNSVGIIDSSYTMDTIKATLYVDSDTPKIFFKNDRILQMVIVPYGIVASEIPPTEERKGGYGSTGA